MHEVMADGTLLATLALDGGWELFAIGADDGRRSVTRGDESTIRDVAAHGARQIAFPVERPTPVVAIHDLVGNRSRTIPVPTPLSSLDWSPDGTHIVGMTTMLADQIVVVDVEAGEARTVTLACGDQCEFAFEGVVSGPTWPHFLAQSAAPWHFLYFLPLPQWQGSLRPSFGSARRIASTPEE